MGKKYDSDDISGAFFGGLVVGCVIVVIFTFFCFAGDSTDTINTKKLGTILCEQDGLLYDYRVIENNLPVIHCKENVTETESYSLVKWSGN